MNELTGLRVGCKVTLKTQKGVWSINEIRGEGDEAFITFYQSGSEPWILPVEKALGLVDEVISRF